MKNPSLGGAPHPAPPTPKKRRPLPLLILLALIAACSLCLWSCIEEGEPVDKPDEYTHVYEAKERFVLRAIAQVFNAKDLGKARIDADRHEVTSDYIVQDDWRTRSLARLRKISRSETEVTLSVITEKKTSTGWELRRLLGKEQYRKIFDAIESQIYREMYRGD
jgi:hypothetical protein